MTDKTQKASIAVLQECAELQLKKASDYQNPNSRIHQADYYPRGVASVSYTHLTLPTKRIV